MRVLLNINDPTGSHKFTVADKFTAARRKKNQTNAYIFFVKYNSILCGVFFNMTSFSNPKPMTIKNHGL